MNPRVSVVVPTFRRPDLLECCLSALLAQDLCPEAYEIIIADDARSEETRRQVVRCAQRARLRGRTVRYVAPSCGSGPAAARNAGWRAARGEIIAFTDDDCVPSPAWLRSGLAAFADERERVDGVSGGLIMPLPADPTDYELNASNLAHAEFVTANCFYRRVALESVGGLDERFTAAWREDSDLHFSLLQRGARLVRAPEAVVLHPIRRARWGMSLRQQRKSSFDALLYKKHPALYRRFVQPAPPWHYYGMVGAMLGALALWVGGRRRIPWVLAGLWLTLTARFCAQRLEKTSHAPAHVLEISVTSALIPPLAIYWRLRGALRWRIWFL